MLGRCAIGIAEGKLRRAWSGRRSSSAIERSCASVDGKRCASRLSGMALRGPTRRRCCRSKCTSLSPPRPLVRTSTASTMVRQPPTSAPSARISGPAAGDHRDIGGGAAHVGDHEVLEPGEKSRAHDARRRTRQDGLDRILERHLGLHQRTVALDDHQRRIDRLLDQHSAERLDEMADLRREPRVQRGGERAARRIELRAQFVRAGHRLRRQCADDAARPQLMRRIAHREIGGDRERFDAGPVLAHRALDGGLVQRLGFLAGRGVAARNARHHAVAVALETRALDHGLVETDHERAHGAEAVFDHGIGGERGRHGHEAHLCAAGAVRAARQNAEHRADRLTDADRKIPGGGQRLCARDDAPRRRRAAPRRYTCRRCPGRATGRAKSRS